MISMTKTQFLKGIELLHLKFSVFDKKTMTTWHFTKQEIQSLYSEISNMNYKQYMTVCIQCSKATDPPKIETIKEQLGVKDATIGQLDLFTIET